MNLKDTNQQIKITENEIRVLRKTLRDGTAVNPDAVRTRIQMLKLELIRILDMEFEKCF